MWRPRAQTGEEKQDSREEPVAVAVAMAMAGAGAATATATATATGAGRETSGLRGVRGSGPEWEWRRWDMGKDTC